MDTKTLSVLEYPKILERLAANCSFSASLDLARKLQPSTHLEEIQRLQAETSEARRLIAISEASIGGAHDVRPAVELARRGGVIDPREMLDIKSTLISARNLKKMFEKTNKGETEEPRQTRTRVEGLHTPENPYPHLSEIALGLPVPARHRGCHLAHHLRPRRGARLGLPQTRLPAPRDQDRT